jgi:hypothetical protein
MSVRFNGFDALVQFYEKLKTNYCKFTFDSLRGQTIGDYLSKRQKEGPVLCAVLSDSYLIKDILMT